MDQQQPLETGEPLLGPDDRTAALALVRSAVETVVREGRRLEPPGESRLASLHCAAFVTLTRNGALRGCVGLLEPPGPLDQTLVHCAVAAATQDRRFQPVSPVELTGLRCEISILSPLREVAGVEMIEVGRHGLLVRARGRQGLLLPQVPTEQGWDRPTYLEYVCRKAGLPKDAWSWPDSRLWSFTAQVFAETDR